jgi:hypothetical protein
MRTIKMISITVLLFLSMIQVTWSAEYREGNTPEDVVLNHFTALQNQDFDKHYDLVSATMHDGRTREAYIEDWKNIVKVGQVEVIEFGITSSKIDGDTATVEAWNVSSDVFNVLGIKENEIDRLILIDGVWKIDETEVLLE